MSNNIVYYEVFHNDRSVGTGECPAPFFVGRQGSDEDPRPIALVPGKQAKLIIAPLEIRSVPRNALRVEINESTRKIFVQNVHSQVELFLRNGASLGPAAKTSLGTSGNICFPDGFEVSLSLVKTLSMPPPSDEPEVESGQSFHYLQRSTDALPALAGNRLLSMIDQGTHTQVGERQELAIRLVKTTLEAFKQPAGSQEFFEAACQAAIQMIEVDRVLMLQKQTDEWICRSSVVGPDIAIDHFDSSSFSRSLLAEMESSGRTTVVEPQMGEGEILASMALVDRAVASPILDDKNRVVGALYGERQVAGATNDQPIGELEAAMLEVLASGISSSLAVEREQNLRNSMSQFFSPVVLSQLTNDPTLLNERETDVSVLFCDIRGFSTVTERIGTTKAIEWINDVLTVLSECVLAHDGVLVDYVGDELMAMWGAPGEQTDHAERACLAALDMLAQQQPLSDKWRDVISHEFGFGIGINSGLASVGNTGSRKKFKYGPLGNTVNVASRVQGITKQMRVPALITGETASAVATAGFQTRRLATARAVGIQRPVDLFELCEMSINASTLCKRFESALSAFETNDLNSAAGMLASLVQDYPGDGPTIILLSRAVHALTQPDVAFDPVWNLTQK